MRDTLHYLLADTVEAHLPPLFYRFVKFAVVSGFALIGATAGLQLALAAAIAGGLLYVVALADAVVKRLVPDPHADEPLRSWPSLAADKLRDAALCALPWALAARAWWVVAVCVLINLALIRVRD